MLYLADRIHEKDILSESRSGKSSLWEIPIFKALDDAPKSPPRSQAPGTWLWILKVFPTRASQEMDHPFTRQLHSQRYPAGAWWSQEDIHYCMLQETGAEAEQARADYQWAFDLSLDLHVGIYEFHWWCFSTFSTSWFHCHKSSWPLSQAWHVFAAGASHGELMFGYQADVINI